MKKRETRNYSIIIIFLLSFLLVTSLALAGPGSKISAKAKSITEKKIDEDTADKKEKAEARKALQVQIRSMKINDIIRMLIRTSLQKTN